MVYYAILQITFLKNACLQATFAKNKTKQNNMDLFVSNDKLDLAQC